MHCFHLQLTARNLCLSKLMHTGNKFHILSNFMHIHITVKFVTNWGHKLILWISLCLSYLFFPSLLPARWLHRMSDKLKWFKSSFCTVFTYSWRPDSLSLEVEAPVNLICKQKHWWHHLNIYSQINIFKSNNSTVVTF